MSYDTGQRTATILAYEADTLRCAVDAVDGAVRALRIDPSSPSVVRAVLSAQALVAQLPAGLVATTMRRLLDTVEECRRTGLDSSGRLIAQRSAAARAVRFAVHAAAS